MKALVGAFNQEKKALVGAFSVIVQPVVELMEHYTALLSELLTTDHLNTLSSSLPGAPGITTLNAKRKERLQV